MAARNTEKKQSDAELSFKVKGSTLLEKGHAAVLSAGYAVPSSSTAGRVTVGRVKRTADNSAGADGAISVTVESGTFLWDNAGDVAQAHVGALAYWSAANTVTATAGGSVAGEIVEVSASGVWVKTDPAAVALLAMLMGSGGAGAVGILDAGTLYTATTVEAALAEVRTLTNKAPAMQVGAATLASGTATVNTGIVVAANSEVIPIAIGAITGSTNYGGLRELKSSRVNGAAGTGTIVLEAVGADGAKDADAAGAIRFVILTPQ